MSALMFLLPNDKWERDGFEALCMKEGTNIIRKQYLCLKYSHRTALICYVKNKDSEHRTEQEHVFFLFSKLSSCFRRPVRNPSPRLSPIFVPLSQRVNLNIMFISC